MASTEQLEPPANWFEQLRQKDEQITTLERKLDHFRSWLSNLQGQLQAKDPQIVKNARRLYVGGIPEDTKEEELRTFFEGIMHTTGASCGPGAAVASCKISSDKSYAFLEMRSVEEASNAMAFDGIVFHDTNLKIRRPSNYNAAEAIALGPVSPDPTVDVSELPMCKTVVEDSWNKVFIGGLPCNYGDEQVKELLQPYGVLKSFNLVMDKATGKSKGYAFCEFTDPNVIPSVIKGLHMQCLERKVLTVKRALEGTRQGGGQRYMGAPLGTSASSNSLGSGGRPLLLPPPAARTDSGSGSFSQHHHHHQQPHQQHFGGGSAQRSGGSGFGGHGFAPQGLRGMGAPSGRDAGHQASGAGGAGGFKEQQQQQQQQEDDRVNHAGYHSPRGFFYMAGGPSQKPPSEGVYGAAQGSGMAPYYHHNQQQQQQGPHGSSRSGGGYGRQQQMMQQQQQHAAREGHVERPISGHLDASGLSHPGAQSFGSGYGSSSQADDGDVLHYGGFGRQQQQYGGSSGRHQGQQQQQQQLGLAGGGPGVCNRPVVNFQQKLEPRSSSSSTGNSNSNGMAHSSPRRGPVVPPYALVAGQYGRPGHVTNNNNHHMPGSTNSHSSSLQQPRVATDALRDGSSSRLDMQQQQKQQQLRQQAASSTDDFGLIGGTTSPMAAITARSPLSRQHNGTLSPGIGGGTATAAAALGMRGGAGTSGTPGGSSRGTGDLSYQHQGSSVAAAPAIVTASGSSGSSSSLYHHDSMSGADAARAAAAAAAAAAGRSAGHDQGVGAAGTN